MTGPLSLEVFNDVFRGGSTADLARDGYRSLVAVIDDVARQEPGVQTGRPPLPPRQRVRGVEFLEFATGGDEAAAVASQLSQLGFAPVGRHVSKQVVLWQQDGVRIVVNTEPSGFAHSSYLTHGTGVCDMGLRVDDAAAVFERARSLGAQPFTQTVGPGELEIPAIRSVGGSVQRFIDDDSGLSRVWEVEFRYDGATPEAGTGIVGIDHVALTVTHGEILSWTLFYTTLFGMEKASMVDVIDPDGLVRSQAVASADRGLRLTLNGAETHRTLAGGFLADSFGSAVQHIAFATKDIFATAEALAANGFEALPIPENYYDDLAGRFELDPGLIDRMRGADILYDADETGEFFQLYGRPWAGGLFFEIVERRGGYDGYGAPNAPFRIAAQKRLLRAKGMPRL